MHRHPGEPYEAQDEHGQARQQRRLGAEAGVQPRGEAKRENPDADADGQECDPGSDGAVAEHVLHEQHAQEEHPEQARDHQELDDVGARYVARAEDAQRDQRLASRRLPGHERCH